MPQITHVTAIRDAMVDLVVDAIDAGTTDTTGDLVIMTSGDVPVATLSWTATPAFGASSNGTATMNAINDDASAVGGIAALFKFQDRDNNEVFRGIAGTAGEDLNLSSTNIGATDTISITSFTYTGPT